MANTSSTGGLGGGGGGALNKSKQNVEYKKPPIGKLACYSFKGTDWWKIMDEYITLVDTLYLRPKNFEIYHI